MSPKHTSAQRRRQAAKTPVHEMESLLTAVVRSAVAGAPVTAMETEFAGYFNQLGFRLDLAQTASDGDVRELGNRVLAALTTATAQLAPPYTWIVGLYRSDQLLRVVSAESQPQWVCGECNTDHSSYLTTCPFCGSPRA